MKSYLKGPLLGLGTAALLSVPPSLAAAEPLVYIPLGSAGEILVLDAETDQTLKAIEDVPAVHGLAGTSDGRYLVAGSYEEAAANGAEAPAKPDSVSQADHEAHHTKGGSIQSTNEDAVSSLSVIDTKNGEVIRRIAVPGAVHHVTVSSTGLTAVVTHPNQDAISVVSLESFEVTKTIKSGSLPNYAVFNSDGTRLYVSNSGDNKISELDSETWKVRREFVTKASPEHMVISLDDEKLYGNNADDGSVFEISLSDRALALFEVGGLLHGIDLSDDGQTLFVSAREGNQVVAIDLESGEIARSATMPSPYHLTAIDGTAELYVSSAEEPKIWVFDQQTLSKSKEIAVRGEGHQMVVMQQRASVGQ